MNRIAPASLLTTCLMVLGLASPGLSLAAAAQGATAGADTGTTAAEWHPQQMTFNYSGFTTLYSCDGIEDKVRNILLAFGARKDLKVRATGCDEGASRPSRFAFVRAEFNTLAPATDPAATAAVKSAWAKVQIAPHRPDFMGAGECELVEQMKDMLQKGFTLRNAEFRTACIPHQVSMADYSVTAEVLKSAAP
ncbi:MAG TPA: hypothetical protein VK130_02685 [Steroidobacteraceae bacterium]|nr:hypothetical protein [Steroidobacteraceae bacterium]